MKPKMRGLGLTIRTFQGESGTTYLVFRTKAGAFHVFSEIESKEAARDCGVKEGTTHQMWETLWRGGEAA